MAKRPKALSQFVSKENLKAPNGFAGIYQHNHNVKEWNEIASPLFYDDWIFLSSMWSSIIIIIFRTTCACLSRFRRSIDVVIPTVFRCHWWEYNCECAFSQKKNCPTNQLRNGGKPDQGPRLQSCCRKPHSRSLLTSRAPTPTKPCYKETVENME